MRYSNILSAFAITAILCPLVVVCSALPNSGHAQTTGVGGSVPQPVTGQSGPIGTFYETAPVLQTPAIKAAKAARSLFYDDKIEEAMQMSRTSLRLAGEESMTRMLPDAPFGDSLIGDITGFCLVEAGDDAEALKWLLPLMRRGGGSYLSEYVAVALARTGDAAGAAKLLSYRNWDYFSPAVEKLWKLPVQRDPSTELLLRAWHNLGEESMSHRDDTAALRHFKAAEAIDSHSTLVQYDLGMAYTNLGQYKDAAISYAWAAKAGNPDLRKAAKKELEHVRAIVKSQTARPVKK